MRRKSIFFVIYMLVISCVFSQTFLPQGMVNLLPEGVTANISNATVGMKSKDLVVAGNNTIGYLAFFAATDAINGEELWATDGTVTGTRLVKDIWPGSSNSNINYLTQFNDKVVFAADDGVNGTELWISNGTEEGTYIVSNIHISGASDPRGFTQLNEIQFIFIAKNADSGTQSYLYVSDGSPDGTQLIYECDARFPGAEYLSTSYVTPYCRVGRKVFFKASTPQNGEELWVTDGTTLGTKMVKDINDGIANSSINHFVNFYNEKLFFKANNTINGNEPWASDGTEEGTYMIRDTNPGTASGNVSTPGVQPYNGKIYFRGYDPDLGVELACTNLELGDHTVYDINLTSPTASNSSSPDTGVEFDGAYFFDANAAGTVGIETHYFDGSVVTLHSDRAPSANFFIRDQVVVSGSLYWYNGGGPNTSSDYFQIFRLDSKTDDIERITTLYTDNQNHHRFHSLRNLDGNLLFASFPVANNVTSPSANSLYSYNYRKPNYNSAIDKENLEIEFRTRADIATNRNSITKISPTVSLENSELMIQNIGSEAKVLIFDVVGKKIADQKVNNDFVVLKLPSIGIFMIVIESQNDKWIKKVIN